MRELSWRFHDSCAHLLSMPHVLNPVFEGSDDVGGANADLIVDGALIDIKTSVQRRIDPRWMWQLLGYALLDYSDSRRGRKIGLYMSRQGILFQWGLEEAINGLSDGGPTDIATLREEFKYLLQSKGAPSRPTKAEGRFYSLRSSAARAEMRASES